MDMMQQPVQEDPFDGFGEFVPGPAARAKAVRFKWPLEAQLAVKDMERAVLDWKALAEEFQVTLVEVGNLMDFENFKKVNKPVLQDHIMKAKKKVDETLAFQIVLVQP